MALIEHNNNMIVGRMARRPFQQHGWRRPLLSSYAFC